MSNLGLGQTSWNRVFRESGVFFRAIKILTDVLRKFDPQYARCQAIELYNTTPKTSLWNLTGAQIGENTDEDGFLYVRITDETPGAGQATVDLYKAAGGSAGDKVATGSGANGATITLSASNSSGLTGTVKIGTITTTENDVWKVQVFPDLGLQADAVWDGTVANDAASKDAFRAASAVVASLLNQSILQMRGGLNTFALDRIADLMQSAQGSLISADAQPDADNNVETLYEGILEDMRLNMADETTPATQYIVKSVIAAASVAFDANNSGAGTMTAPTMEERAPAGTLTFICEEDEVGQERFAVSIKDSTTGLVTRGRNLLQIGRDYSDPDIGIRSARLERSPSFNAPDNDDFATISDWTFEGESSSNTNDGILYFKTAAGTADPAKFVTKIYKSASYATSSLVAQTDEGAANAVVGINAKNGSGLTGTGKIGDAPAAAQTCTFDLKCFRKSNASGVPDKFTCAITATSRAEFSQRIGELGYRVNSATSGSETIDDSYASAGTFPAYSVRNC